MRQTVAYVSISASALLPLDRLHHREVLRSAGLPLLRLGSLGILPSPRGQRVDRRLHHLLHGRLRLRRQRGQSGRQGQQAGRLRRRRTDLHDAGLGVEPPPLQEGRIRGLVLARLGPGSRRSSVHALLHGRPGAEVEHELAKKLHFKVPLKG